MRQEDEAGLLPWSGLGEDTLLVRWDARGHGASEATLRDEDYRWSELARDAWAVADALEREQVVLGGFSMGAGTALHAATIAPERTRGLVVMAPPTAWETRPRQARLYRSSASLIDRVGLGPFRLFGALGSCFAGNRGVGRVQRSVMDGLGRADPRAVVTALRGAALSDLPKPGRIAKLAVPALVLAWRGDPSHPLSTAEELAKLLPNAQLDVAGDLAGIEAWPETTRRFLEDLS